MSDRPRTNPKPMSPGCSARRRRRGFTLLESMMAATVLGVVVLAVISAVTTAQRLSFEGQKRLLATMAADDFMIELSTVPYHELKTMSQSVQDVGAMTTFDGAAYPGSFWAIGRRVEVEPETVTDPGIGVSINGVRVTVTAFDAGADLVHLTMFVPEPMP